MEETTNRDMRPSADMLVLAGDLACLVDAPDIVAAFERYERIAKRWKRRYTLFGIVALAASFLGIVLLGAQLTMPGLLPARSVLVAAIGLGLAVVGLVAAAFFLAAKPRERWLFARFAAEWLRCLKFRMFFALGEASTLGAVRAEVAARSATALGRFRYRMLGGASAMSFSPREVIRDERPSSTGGPTPWLATARILYADMRVGVQLQHFESCKHDKEGEIRPARSAGDLFFLGALLLTLAQVGIDGANLLLARDAASAPGPAIAALMAFGSWIFFAASATLLIWERGRATSVDHDRYDRYHAEIKEAAAGLHEADLPTFMTIVANVEDLCLRELQDFCRDNARASYLG